MNAKKTFETFYDLTEEETAAFAPAKPKPEPKTKPSPADVFEIENGVLIKYTGNGGEVVIPKGVTGIGEKAFYACLPLTGVTIPDGVINIGDWAFCGCSNLRNATIPGSVTRIGDNTFNCCFSLTLKCPEDSYAENYCRHKQKKYKLIG